MTFVFWGILIALLCFSFLSCFINKIPGPFLLFVCVLLAQLGLDIHPGWDCVAIVGVIAVVAFILSKVMTKTAKKIHEYTKAASVATTIASLIGLAAVAGSAGESDSTIAVIFLVGFVVLPFVFAFIVESVKRKSAVEGIKGALSATLVYLADTALKLGAFAYAIYAMFLND